MNTIPTAVRLALAALCLALAAWFGATQLAEPVIDPPAGAIVVAPIDTTPVIIAPTPPTDDLGADTPRADRLGVVVTMIADGLIRAANTELRDIPAIRFMADGHKDYEVAGQPLSRRNPAAQPPIHAAPTTDPNKVWSFPEPGVRQNINRVATLAQMAPDATLIVVADEYAAIMGDDARPRDWVAPGKQWQPVELGMSDDFDFTPAELALAERESYELTRAYLTSLEAFAQTRLVLYEMANESWFDRLVPVRNAELRGCVRAHREHVAAGGHVRLALGPAQRHNRQLWGRTIAEGIETYPPDVLVYLNEVHGYASMHFYVSDAEGDRTGGFAAPANASTAPEWQEWRGFVAFLHDRYPSITPYVGEMTFTRSAPWANSTPAERAQDQVIISQIATRLIAERAHWVCLYMYAQPGTGEGKFMGGEVRTILPYLRKVGRTPAAH